MLKKCLITMALLSACTGSEPVQETPENNDPVENTAKTTTPKLDLAQLQKAAEEVALVPSPAEMQKSLKNAGLKSDLAQMVSQDRDIKMDIENKDNLAVRTGVVLADLVLTVTTASKERKIDQMKKLKVGFDGLGAGSDIQATLDDLITQITNDAMNNDDLLKEMDELSGVMVSELEYEAGEWVVPLIQAGSWLEGANLVSGAIIAESQFVTASQLLKQPRVVDYFLKYVEREGREKAADQVVDKLLEVLKSLKTIAAKESLGEADVQEINKATNEVLSML